MTFTTYDELQQRHISEMRKRIPEHMQKTSWTRERIQEERKQKLRSMIRIAKERSAWHRERLAKIDPDSINEDYLSKLPVMTKSDLMKNFDQIVTDNRITLSLVNEHLSKLTQSDAYLLDEFHVIASGGTSGLRGVYVYDWEGWMTCFLSYRNALRASMDPKSQSGATAFVVAQHPSHLSASLTRTFVPHSLSSGLASQWFPVTLPLEEIVHGLNSMQPTGLTTYPSFLNLLSQEAMAGRLKISPRGISTTAEPLLPNIREAAERQWGIPVINYYGSSEAGELAWACGKSRGMHLNEDLHIVEFVDEKGQPVPPGVRASKLYLTNLFNFALPIIRYEITDEVTFLPEGDPCPCGCTFRKIDDIQGRLDDVFRYADGKVVHPLIFYSALGHFQMIVEYQVRQREEGAEIYIVTSGPVSPYDVEKEVVEGLDRAGLKNAKVSVKSVEKLERTNNVGKLKRFIPLPKI